MGKLFTTANYTDAFSKMNILNAYKNSIIIPVFRMEFGWGIAGSGKTWMSLLSVILPQIAGNMAFAIVVLTGYIRSLPIDLEEAAFMEGCNAYSVSYGATMIFLPSSFSCRIRMNGQSQDFFLKFLPRREPTMVSWQLL